jgi:hypothetical protein
VLKGREVLRRVPPFLVVRASVRSFGAEGLVGGWIPCRGAKGTERLFQRFKHWASDSREDLAAVSAVAGERLNQISRYRETNETSECLANLMRGGSSGGDVGSAGLMLA